MTAILALLIIWNVVLTILVHYIFREHNDIFTVILDAYKHLDNIYKRLNIKEEHEEEDNYRPTSPNVIKSQK